MGANVVLPTWLQVLTALLTPIIALVVTYIGFQQWKVASRKLSLELFQKRYHLYNRIIECLWSDFKPEEHVIAIGARYHSLVMESKFLFELDVYAYLMDNVSLANSVGRLKSTKVEDLEKEIYALTSRLIEFESEFSSKVATYLPIGRSRPSEFDAALAMRTSIQWAKSQRANIRHRLKRQEHSDD